MNLPLSILDLAPVSSDTTSAQALHNSIDLARLVDRLGYTRYWLAEHHNVPSVAIATPEIMIAVVARETSRLRVGAGGVMLPNHAPLKVAEAFRTLEALYPGRIDLGIGRAPGTDQLTAYALRRSQARLKIDDFPEQLAELLAFGNGGFPSTHPFHAIHAMPRAVSLPPIWLLGSSSGHSAQLAATTGSGFAFAYHINPNLSDVLAALQTYRAQFTPALHLTQPCAILAVEVICSETDEQADELATVGDLAFLWRRRGESTPLPSLAEAQAYLFTPAERALACTHRARQGQIIGSPATVRACLEALVEQTGVNEVMVRTTLSAHEARLHSYELLANAFALEPGGG